MGAEIDGTTIKIIQGDDATIPYDGLEPNSLIYFEVRNKKNQPVFEQVKARADYEGYLEIRLKKEDTDKLRVKPTERYQDYYHGIKRVDEETGKEDTIFLGNSPRYGDRYIMRVYPKQAEGI